ncbi:MAG: hypothetical protein JJE46_00730 [Acidimicrobiia bacterium]|nr:hypothetical protein [Acidimicrobiia bacterium]
MRWKRQRTRAAELAAVHAETARMQVNLLRIELTKLHEELARRDIEMLSALSRASNVNDTLRQQLEAEHTTHARLARSIDRLAMFLAAPPMPVPIVDTVAPAAQGAGTIIGGTIDPTRAPQAVDAVEVIAAIDLTDDAPVDLRLEVPVAPTTRDERPLACEVHLQFGDRWIDGFQIEETIQAETTTQFRLRRRVDGWILPELFDESEVRVFVQPAVDPSRS